MAKEPQAVSAPVERKKRTPIDPNETPRQRFERIAGGRAGAAQKAIRLLSNLAGGGVEYSSADIDKLEKGLGETLKDTCAALRTALDNPNAVKSTVRNPRFKF